MTTALNDAITQAALALVMTAITATLGMATAWLNSRRRWANVQTKQQDLALAKGVIADVVHAVEQVAAARGWDGAAKYQAAFVRARAMLDDRGIRITDAQVDAFLEQAVLALRSAYTTVTVTPPVTTEPPADPPVAPPVAPPAVTVTVEPPPVEPPPPPSFPAETGPAPAPVAAIRNRKPARTERLRG